MSQPLGDHESARARRENALRRVHITKQIKLGPNWLCDTCEDLGYWVDGMGGGNAEDTPCEECPRCEDEGCDAPLHESEGRHLLDPITGVRWCDLGCTKEVFNTNEHARLARMGLIYGEWRHRCVENAEVLTDDVQNMDCALRERLAAYSVASAVSVRRRSAA